MNPPMLREARSSPYIVAQPEASSNGTGGHINNRVLQSTASNDRFEQAFGSVMQFNADSSSSSTDLQFFCSENRPTNAESLKQHWAAKGHDSQRHSEESRHGQRPERNKAESADNLAEAGHQSEQSSLITEISEPGADCTGNTNFLGKHRSETNLPGKAARDGGFRLLEKCCSVELSPAKMMIPPSRLARSKEMPNIADVDDSEIATYDC